MYSEAISKSRIRHPGISLKDHGLAGGADILKQAKVLHIAGADLNHIGKLCDGLQVAWVEHLGHDGQPGRRPRLR